MKSSLIIAACVLVALEIFKPYFAYMQSGKWRQWGVGGHKTLFTPWMCAILVALAI